MSYVLACNSDEYGEFYVGPFRSHDKAVKALERLRRAGTLVRFLELEPWSAQLDWIRGVEREQA